MIGAGRGIGRSIALRFAAEGAGLVLAARTTADLEKTAEACSGLGARCSVQTADIANSSAIAGIFEAAGPFGRLDVLVNAAAIMGPVGPFQEVDATAWEQAMRVNLLGTVNACRAGLKFMIEQGSGSIINFSGGGGSAPLARFSAYATSKAAVVRFTETLAEELSNTNIRVNAIAPGMVNTTLHDAVLKAKELAGLEYFDKVRRLRDSGVGGSPPELAAELALFLASDDSHGLTGRLVSAPHDGWREWDREQIERIAGTQWYTLRRIDPYTIGRLGRIP